MQNEEFDIQVLMLGDEPTVIGRTPAGFAFILGFWEWTNVDEFLDSIPPGLRVGLLNPETNLFAQLPTRSLH